jgi:molybdopterin molybdotransferase
MHQASDIMVLSGGVSMGKFDYVPRIMEQLGMTLVFHKILQRPGLPMWFGVSADAKPVFALPGNPVSSLVCLTRYATPAILSAMGAGELGHDRVQLAEAMQFDFDLTRFIPVVLKTDESGARRAIPRAINTSGDFTALAGTHGIVELTRDADSFAAGYAAPFFPW